MKNLDVIVLYKPNITDFAFERNKLLKASKKDWILFLDKDEILTEKLKDEISNTIKSTEFNGFYIKRKIIFCGIDAGEDKMLKLGRNGCGTWKRKVHEYWDINGKVGMLNNYIIHNTATNLKEYINKVDYHSTLHSKEILREGKISSITKIIIYPIGNFIVYLIKSKNIVFSIMKSLHSFLAWTKLYFLQH